MRQLVFLQAQNVAQVRHLLAHFFEQLVDRINFEISVFETLQCIPDGQLLCSPHQNGLVGVLSRGELRKLIQQREYRRLDFLVRVVQLNPNEFWLRCWVCA